jgi:hypothetical protein
MQKSFGLPNYATSLFKEGKISEEKFKEIWQGWCAYSCWSNNHKLKTNLLKH